MQTASWRARWQLTGRLCIWRASPNALPLGPWKVGRWIKKAAAKWGESQAKLGGHLAEVVAASVRLIRVMQREQKATSFLPEEIIFLSS